MKTLTGALFFIVTISATAQTAPLVSAPSQGERFPAAWYQDRVRPGDAAPTTQAPITGAPYSATMVTTTRIPARGGHDAVTVTQRDLLYRDGAGRMRTEQSRNYDAVPSSHQVTQSYKEIDVDDPVAHCKFHWVEPWTGEGPPTATVSCYPEMYFSPWDTSWGVESQTSSQVKSENQTTDTEPLGHKAIDGWDVVGARTTITAFRDASPNRPAQTMQTVLERWWSPQLNEVLWYGPVTAIDRVPTFELKDIHAGEPDAALFYPPANFQIVSQPRDPYH